jgi:ATP-dependent Clp protease protease subunit
MSRAKLSRLMDAETWMNANKAVELGFADEILQRDSLEDAEPQTASAMAYSRAEVTNSLMEKLSARCRIEAKPTETKTNERSVSDLMERLNLIRN